MGAFTSRRVVTGFDATGQSVITSDSVMDSKNLDPAADILLLWSTATFPSDNTDPTDGATRQVGLRSEGGSAIQLVSMAPQTSSPHHATQTLDYGIALKGDIELVTDDGTVTKLSPGDVVVQRGTGHTWRNASATQDSQMLFVLLDALPIPEYSPAS